MRETNPKLSMMACLAALVVAFGATSPVLAEERVIDVNFDDASPGEIPPGLPGLAYLADETAGEVRIVDSTTTPADPFGGEGNHSLYVIDSGSDKKMPRFAWRTSTPIKTLGRLSLKFYHPEPSVEANTGPALITLTIGQQRRNDEGQPTVIVDGGPTMLLRQDGRIRYTTVPDTGPNVGRKLMPRIAQSFPRKAVHELVVDFDVEKQQWSATLDGVRLTDRHDHHVSFAFHKHVEQIDVIQLRVGLSIETNQHAFFDDIVMTADPEAPSPESSGTSAGSVASP